MAKLIHLGAATTATELYTRWRGEMAQSKIGGILTEAKAYLRREGSDIISLQEKINYLENQQSRMDYAKYRANSLIWPDRTWGVLIENRRAGPEG